ncbi:MAG: hydroxylamine reductase, partial [Deltaproteobacteria bacterium]|nr:hydroxylamine reductase [Deltaproteobacteria bacterium]
MATMFCFQCEQTTGGKGCVGTMGKCGKTEDVAFLQDRLTGELIKLAKAANSGKPTDRTRRLMLEGLFATVTNVNFDGPSLERLIDEVSRERAGLSTHLATTSADDRDGDLSWLWTAQEDIRSLKSLVLFGLRGMAAYAYHALVLGLSDEKVTAFFYKALEVITDPDVGVEELS